MNRTWCFRLYPNRSQERILLEMADRVRELYNMDIAYRRAYYENIGRYTKSSVSAMTPVSSDKSDRGAVNMSEQWNTKRFLRRIRNEYPEYKIVPSNVIDTLCRDIDAQYSATFTKRKEGDVNAWFPGFRKRHVVIVPISFQKPNGNGETHYEEGSGRFSKLTVRNVGDLKVRSHRKLPVGAEICEVEVIRKDHWYVYLSLNYDGGSVPVPENCPVGIDLGIRTTIALSDATELNKPDYESQTADRLAAHQRKLSRQVMGSKRYWKTKRKIRAVHEKNTRRRDYWWHRVTKRLSDHYSEVFYEDLTLAFMNEGVIKSNRKKSYEIAFGKIKALLGYKMGKRARVVNPYNTSKMCCQCGNVDHSFGANKIYSCSHCGLIIDCDLNASVNILKLGLFHRYDNDAERLQYMDFPYLCALKRNVAEYKKGKKVEKDIAV